MKKPSKIINGLQDAVAYAKGDTTRATSHTVRVPQLRNAGEIMVPLHVIMNLAKHLQFEQIDGHGDALSLCQIKNAESVIREFAKRRRSVVGNLRGAGGQRPSPQAAR
jgi:hypothetical protein